MKRFFKAGIGVILSAAVATSFAGAVAAAQLPLAARNTPAKKEPVTLTMINRINADVTVENNPLYDYIRDLTGYNIEIEAPPINNYVDRLQIVMASGDLPDIIYNWNFDQNYVKWSLDGLLLPVEEYVKDYPNIMHNVTPAMYDFARVPDTGLVYAVPKPNKVNRWGMVINKQWLEKFEIEAPSTIDELYEFGVMVANDDPDGNGQKDTYLYSPVSNETDSVFADSGVIVDAFLPWVKFGAPDFDGEYKIREKMDGYYPYLEFMNKLYSEKIIDPEYFVNKMYDDVTKQKQDRVSIVKGHDSNIINDVEWNNNDKFDKFDFVPPIKGTDGVSRNYATPAVWGGWCISADSKNVADALGFIDWGNSPEGFEVLNYGIIGEHYNSFDLTERVLDRTVEQEEVSRTLLSSYTTIAYAYEGLLGAISAQPKRVEVYGNILDNYFEKVEEIEIPSVKVPEYEEFLQKYPDLATKKVEYENKYIIGDITLSQLKDFINNEYLPKAADYEAAYLKMMEK